MTTSVIEFAVQMTCKACVNKIDTALRSLDDVLKVDISLEKGSVVVETNLPSTTVQEIIEATGRKAVLKGYGSQSGTAETETFAAVAMLGGETGYSFGSVRGVIRMLQADMQSCVIDGTLDGLTPGQHGLHIHECGDLSQGCNSVGNHFDLNNACHGAPTNDPSKRHTGDLGNIEANHDGRAAFRLVDKVVKVQDVFGRAFVVTEKPDDLGLGGNPQSLEDGNSGKRLACGIISRSAGLFENAKLICACDGVSLWDERSRSMPGVKQPTQSKQPQIVSASSCTHL